jgi:hypothetical protein
MGQLGEVLPIVLQFDASAHLGSEQHLNEPKAVRCIDGRVSQPQPVSTPGDEARSEIARPLLLALHIGPQASFIKFECGRVAFLRDNQFPSV